MKLDLSHCMVVIVYSQWKMCQACDDDRTHLLFYLHLFISSSCSAFPFFRCSPFAFSFGSIYLFIPFIAVSYYLVVSFFLFAFG